MALGSSFPLLQLEKLRGALRVAGEAMGQALEWGVRREVQLNGLLGSHGVAEHLRMVREAERRVEEAAGYYSLAGSPSPWDDKRVPSSR